MHCFRIKTGLWNLPVQIHQATGQFWAELGRTFADATVLPLNASRLAEQLASNYLPGLRKEMNKLLPVEELTPARNSLDNLEHSVQVCSTDQYLVNTSILDVDSD